MLIYMYIYSSYFGVRQPYSSIALYLSSTIIWHIENGYTYLYSYLSTLYRVVIAKCFKSILPSIKVLSDQFHCFWVQRYNAIHMAINTRATMIIYLRSKIIIIILSIYRSYTVLSSCGDMRNFILYFGYYIDYRIHKLNLQPLYTHCPSYVT